MHESFCVCVSSRSFHFHTDIYNTHSHTITDRLAHTHIRIRVSLRLPKEFLLAIYIIESFFALKKKEKKTEINEAGIFSELCLSPLCLSPLCLFHSLLLSPFSIKSIHKNSAISETSSI